VILGTEKIYISSDSTIECCLQVSWGKITFILLEKKGFARENRHNGKNIW
jgi:hypothetical protein